MSKQQIHLCIDSQLYLLLKMRKENISALFETFVSSYVSVGDTQSIKELEVQIEEQKAQRLQTDEKIVQLAAELSKAYSEQQKIHEEKEVLEESVMKAVKASGIMEHAAGKFL